MRFRLGFKCLAISIIFIFLITIFSTLMLPSTIPEIIINKSSQVMLHESLTASRTSCLEPCHGMIPLSHTYFNGTDLILDQEVEI